MEHDDRRQDRAPAGAPRHAYRHRDAAWPGAFRFSAERNHARGWRLRLRAAADAELDNARPGSRRSQAGARHARQSETADPDRGLRRVLVRRLGRIRQIRRAPGRPGAHHHQMQGRDPGGSRVARRLHHRRADRAQTGDGGRPDRHRRARRGGTAAQAVALCAAGAVGVLGAERRCAGAGRSGNHRRPEGAAGRPRAMGARGHELGREIRQEFPK